MASSSQLPSNALTINSFLGYDVETKENLSYILNVAFAPSCWNYSSTFTSFGVFWIKLSVSCNYIAIIKLTYIAIFINIFIFNLYNFNNLT